MKHTRLGPASRTRIFQEGFSESRFARTSPAVPPVRISCKKLTVKKNNLPPTITKSYLVVLEGVGTIAARHRVKESTSRHELASLNNAEEPMKYRGLGYANFQV